MADPPTSTESSTAAEQAGSSPILRYERGCLVLENGEHLWFTRHIFSKVAYVLNRTQVEEFEELFGPPQWWLLLANTIIIFGGQILAHYIGLSLAMLLLAALVAYPFYWSLQKTEKNLEQVPQLQRRLSLKEIRRYSHRTKRLAMLAIVSIGALGFAALWYIFDPTSIENIAPEFDRYLSASLLSLVALASALEFFLTWRSPKRHVTYSGDSLSK